MLRIEITPATIALGFGIGISRGLGNALQGVPSAHAVK